MFAQAAADVYQFLREPLGMLFQRRYRFDFVLPSLFAHSFTKRGKVRKEKHLCQTVPIYQTTLYYSPVCLVLRHSLCIMIAYASWNSWNFHHHACQPSRLMKMRLKNNWQALEHSLAVICQAWCLRCII